MEIPVLETERLTLTPLRVDDARAMVPVLSDASLYKFTGGEPPTLAELEERYRYQTAGSGRSDEVWCNWIVRTRLDGRAVGFVQADIGPASAEVAWVVGVRDQGRGFATEAARVLCDWLRENGPPRIEAHIHPRHVASQAVAHGIGLNLTDEVDDEGEQVWAIAAPGA